MAQTRLTARRSLPGNEFSMLRPTSQALRDRAPARAIKAIVVSARLVAGPNKKGGRGGRTLARGSRDFPCETRRSGEGPDDARPATSERTQAPRFETARAPARRVRTPPGRPDDAQANTNRNVRAFKSTTRQARSQGIH